MSHSGPPRISICREAPDRQGLLGLLGLQHAGLAQPVLLAEEEPVKVAVVPRRALRRGLDQLERDISRRRR
jgi:hypothetical protein